MIELGPVADFNKFPCFDCKAKPGERCKEKSGGVFWAGTHASRRIAYWQAHYQLKR